MGACLLVQVPWAGEPGMRFRTLSPAELLQYNYSLTCGHPPRSMGLDYILILPLLPVSLWPFFILQLQKIFSARVKSFSSIVALKIIVNLVCLWKQVSSGSSYTVILATNPFICHFYVLYLFFCSSVIAHFLLNRYCQSTILFPSCFLLLYF